MSYYRRHLLKKLQKSFLSGKEDRVWANNVIEKNHTIKYDASLVVKHHYTIHGATWKGTG